jgi:hypothetical protein
MVGRGIGTGAGDGAGAFGAEMDGNGADFTAEGILELGIGLAGAGAGVAGMVGLVDGGGVVSTFLGTLTP